MMFQARCCLKKIFTMITSFRDGKSSKVKQGNSGLQQMGLNTIYKVLNLHFKRKTNYAIQRGSTKLTFVN